MPTHHLKHGDRQRGTLEQLGQQLGGVGRLADWRLLHLLERV